MPHVLETAFTGDASSLERAAARASGAVGSSAAEIERANKKIEAAHKKSAEQVGKWGRDMALGLVGAAAVAVDLGIKAEGAAAAIGKAAGTSTEAGKRIEASFRNLSGLEYSGTKVASAFSAVASELGIVEGKALGVEKATKVMQAALDLTDASGGDLTTTTEALGKVMLTYGIHANKAAEASDILFNASKQTGTTVESVAAVLDRMRGRLGALAPSLGETAGLMDEFAKKGITGRQSLSALNGVFSTLLGGSKSTAAMVKELNLRLFDSHGRFVGLRSVIAQLQPTLSKYTQESQLQATKALFGAGANKQLLEIIRQGPGAYEKATHSVSKHGEAAKAAAKEHETLEGKIRMARAAAENLGAALGEKLIPPLTDVLHSLEDGVKWLGKHETAAKALAGVVTTVLGGALTVYAYTKAASFISATKGMIGAAGALAARMGLTAGVVEAADTTIVGANEAAGLSFTAMAGTAVAAFAKIALPLAALIGSIEVLNKVLPAGERPENLLGGNQPGEAGMEGNTSAFLNKYGPGGSPAGKLIAAGQSGKARGHQVSEVAGQIMAFWEARGFSRAAAAGFVGNAQAESNLNPNEAGGGLYQQSGYPSSYGKGSVAQQSQHVLENLPASLRAKLKNVRSPREAAVLIQNEYEKPYKATQHQSRREEEAARAFGEGTQSLPAAEGKTKKAAKAHAEGYANPFAGATGVSRSRTDQGVDFSFSGKLGAVGKGRIVNIVQDPGGFGTEVVEELTEGPHKGQFVYYGLETGAILGISKGASVKAGQKIATGRGSGGIELGFASGASGVPVTPFAPGASHEHATAGGTAFSKFLASIGKGGSNLQLATAQFAEAAKAAAKLMLTAAQTRTLTGIEGGINAAGADRANYGSYGEGADAALERGQAKWSAHPENVGTAAGAAGEKQRRWQVVSSDKLRKTYYERELRDVKKEAAGFTKARNLYLKIARHTADPHAKKEALNKAAAWGAKLSQAQAAAKELGGKIDATENALAGAEGALEALPGEAQAADLSAYQAANAHIDLEERAGLLSPQAAKAAREANASKALSGGFGALSEEGRLQVQGDLREFQKAVESATAAQEEHTSVLKEATATLNAFNQASSNLAHVEAGSFARSLADLVSGQIAGTGYAPRIKVNGGAASY